MQFKKMWDAIIEEAWDRAADEMLDSRWADQVGMRARTLSDMMRTGEE
jgi:lysozyme